MEWRRTRNLQHNRRESFDRGTTNSKHRIWFCVPEAHCDNRWLSTKYPSITKSYHQQLWPCPHPPPPPIPRLVHMDRRSRCSTEEVSTFHPSTNATTLSICIKTNRVWTKVFVNGPRWERCHWVQCPDLPVICFFFFFGVESCKELGLIFLFEPKWLLLSLFNIKENVK